MPRGPSSSTNVGCRCYYSFNMCLIFWGLDDGKSDILDVDL